MSDPHRITIHLTDHPPVIVDDREWPVIARTVWHDADDPGRARDRAYVRVRRSREDGRVIVYGLRVEAAQEVMGGFYVPSDLNGVLDAIRKTCALIGLDPAPVFAEMPAVAL